MLVNKLVVCFLLGSTCLIALQSVAQAYPVEDLHPDWTGRDPIMWRLPLDTGYSAELFVVGEKLLVQLRDLHTLIISRSGQIEHEMNAPYDLRSRWGHDQALLRDDGVVLTLTELADKQETKGSAPIPYELAEVDIWGKVLKRYTIQPEFGDLRLIAAGATLVLLEDDSAYYSAPETEGRRMFALEDGEVVWQHSLPESGWCQAAVFEGGAAIFTDGECLYGISPSGEEVWRHAAENDEQINIFPLGTDSVLIRYGYETGIIDIYDASGLVSSMEGFEDVSLSAEPIKTYALLPNGCILLNEPLFNMLLVDERGQRIWSRNIEYSSYNIVISEEGCFYFLDWDHGLAAMDFNGNYLWVEPRLQQPECNFQLDQDGYLYAINGNELYCVDTNAYTPREPVADDPNLKHYKADQE